MRERSEDEDEEEEEEEPVLPVVPWALVDYLKNQIVGKMVRHQAFKSRCYVLNSLLVMNPSQLV